MQTSRLLVGIVVFGQMYMLRIIGIQIANSVGNAQICTHIPGNLYNAQCTSTMGSVKYKFNT